MNLLLINQNEPPPSDTSCCTFVLIYTIMKANSLTEFFLKHHFYSCWSIDSRKIMIHQYVIIVVH